MYLIQHVWYPIKTAIYLCYIAVIDRSYYYDPAWQSIYEQ